MTRSSCIVSKRRTHCHSSPWTGATRCLPIPGYLVAELEVDLVGEDLLYGAGFALDKGVGEYAVQKISADKSHLFLPNDGLDKEDENDSVANEEADDAMDVDSENEVKTDEGCAASELTRGWKVII